MPETDPSRTEEFVRLLTRHQRRIYLYVLAQLPHRADADDVLQETNVVLWNKFDQFRPGSDFRAWACRIAHYEILKFRQRRGRDSLQFSEEFLDAVAAMSLDRGEELDVRQQALATCLEKLRQKDRDLVRYRYNPGATARNVADRVGRSVDAVYKSLRRIHETLFECIDRTLSREQAQ